MSCLEGYFGSVPDPRGANASYRLGDLIVMMIAASLCGATCATEFSLFAQERRQALSRLIDYDVAPSHDTFSRLLRLIDTQAFARAFAAFAERRSRARGDLSPETLDGGSAAGPAGGAGHPSGQYISLTGVVPASGELLSVAFGAADPLTVLGRVRSG
ncbi:transposase family protein [Rhizobium sp. CG5]|uniref:transposase family protein n=1 Tax=Rhizobium sp. CG5 TaxID=2726076 RepID=UPI0020335A4B|nr:transposase family protein [Rhizobium sp. CG5]